MKNIGLYVLLIIFLLLLLSCEKNEIDKEIKNEPYDKTVTSITIHDNIVWVGTLSNGLYKFNGNSWLNYTTSNGLLSNEITSLLLDNNERLWVGTKMGVSKLEDENWTNLTTDDGLFSNDIRSLDCDKENNIWIGTNRNRTTKYDGTNFTSYHVNPEASGDPGMGHIHTITCDLKGNIWIGSCISGLSKFDGVSWFDYVNDLNIFVTSSICTEDGDVWIGHIGGAYNYSDEVWTKYSEIDGLANHCILCIDIDQQSNIWVGTKKGISRFDGTSWTNYTVDNGPFNDYVSSLACDRDGSIWIGNNNGLIIFTPNL